MLSLKHSTNYSYANGDLLENPQTYQYSVYEGYSFLEAWISHRRTIKSELGDAIEPPNANIKKGEPNSNGYLIDELLERLMGEVEKEEYLQITVVLNNLAILVKKFEVHKRLYNKYDPTFNPVDKDSYHSLSRYLRFAEVIEKAYSHNLRLPYLNVLLKIIDTLIASKDALSDQEKSRLSWLIEREYVHVQKCASKCGVKL